jgi:hypothetical protein
MYPEYSLDGVSYFPWFTGGNIWSEITVAQLEAGIEIGDVINGNDHLFYTTGSATLYWRCRAVVVVPSVQSNWVVASGTYNHTAITMSPVSFTQNVTPGVDNELTAEWAVTGINDTVATLGVKLDVNVTTLQYGPFLLSVFTTPTVFRTNVFTGAEGNYPMLLRLQNLAGTGDRLLSVFTFSQNSVGLYTFDLTNP